MFKNIPVGKIYSKSNCRKENDDTINELMQDILKNGLLQPIVVRKMGDKYEIVAGHRRFLACKNLGEPLIECNVLEDLSDKDRLFMQLSENVQRKAMSAWELCEVFDELGEKYNLKDVQMSQLLHKSSNYVAEQRHALKLLNEQYDGKIPEEAKKLSAGVIKASAKRKQQGNYQTVRKDGYTYTIKGHSYIISCGNYEFEKALNELLETWGK